MNSVQPQGIFGYLLPEASCLEFEVLHSGRRLEPRDQIEHWHQGSVLELEIRASFDLDNIARQTDLSRTGLLLHVVAFSSLTRRNQSWLFDLSDQELWADIELDSSRLGGMVELRFELLPGFDSERLSELAAEPMSKLAEASYFIALETGNSRLRVDVLDFDDSKNYPANALWRIHVEFPTDPSESPDVELNNALWVVLNERHQEFLYTSQARQLLKYEIQCRIITETLAREGLAEHCVRAAETEMASSFEAAVASVFQRYFHEVTSRNDSDYLEHWRTNETQIRTLIQAGSGQ